MRIIKEVLFVTTIAGLVLVGGIFTLQNNLLLGPMILALSSLPLLGLMIAKRRINGAVPDLVFGGIDTGLLAVPALLGRLKLGAVGALAGAVIGDAVTDSIAGFFEGGIARWLRTKGIEEARDPIASSLGKMAGCLLGAGIVLTVIAAVQAIL